ncbi:MAG: hypothetical protein OEM97_04810 [Acidimicrobiia bacterium]|nr:hypothetical protein [Acidimicrobiia bacterium]
MNADTSHWSDEQLMAELGATLDELDPVPTAATEFAKAAFTWRTIDAELAELVFDSADDQLTGVRSTGGARQMTFRAPGLEIEVVVMAEGARRLVGQLVPPQAAEIELLYQGEVRSASSDSLGRFTFLDVPVGPVSIRCMVEGTTVQTDWMIV